jgi:hypothetical protein
MWPPHLNVPLPDPTAIAPQAPAAPSGMEQALPAITSLFSLGTALGGSPRAGAAFLHGAHQTLQQQKQERHVKEQEALKVQQLQQQQAIAAQVREQQAEHQRQQDVQHLITSTQESLKGVTDKDTYERTIGMAENFGREFYQLRPNTIRAMVPYRAPNAQKNLYDAVDKYLKNPANKEAITSGKVLNAAIQVDTDGDGVPDRPVPLAQAIQESGYPVFIDPETKQPILTEKPVKAENVQPFDVAYRGLVDAFKTDKGREPTDKERGTLAVQAQRSLDKPPAAGGDSGLKDYQKFTAGEKLADKWTKISTPTREMNRQFNLMQTGLQRFKQGDKMGGSQAVLVTFQKILDPSSVVRESEYARSSAGLSLISRLEGFADKLQSGGAGVPYADLAAMVETARQFLQSMNDYTAGQRKRLTQSATQYGIDPMLVFDDSEPGADAAPADAAAPKVQIGQVVTVRGQRVRVTKVNADGTYEGVKVR